MRSACALRLVEAQTFRQRLLGLHAWSCWGDAPWGLLLPRCRLVHGLGLAQVFDLVFLGQSGEILRCLPEWPPNRWAACARAWAALELPPGYCRGAGWADRIEQAWALRVGVPEDRGVNRVEAAVQQGGDQDVQDQG
ncbi:hypothetical protein [Castellaniella sp.]|uniref:hypothetical protein n=1 Tax=Castellaniella sp. TaxID=1955812 RepID=UPI002B0001D5|nr:hypothetical protein [Castellaniella sp.]